MGDDITSRPSLTNYTHTEYDNVLFTGSIDHSTCSGASKLTNSPSSSTDKI